MTQQTGSLGRAMKTRCICVGLFLAVGLAVGALSLAVPSPAQLLADEAKKTSAAAPAEEPVSVEQARAQARILRESYESTLEAIHRYYVDQNEKLRIPAKSLEDVFRDLDKKLGTETRWISVSTPAMNIDNEPESDFEKEAAEVLNAGKSEHELLENGTLHYAGTIALRAGCLRCHLSALAESVDRQPVAGFVISIPLEKEVSATGEQ